jgi:hypothetical protein
MACKTSLFQLRGGMRYLCVTCMMLFTIAAPATAGKLYTWTDAHGTVHITETPPPRGAAVQHVIEYTPKSPAEIESIRQEQQALKEQRRDEAVLEAASEARRLAETAKQRAAEAQAAAEAAEQRAEEFRKLISNNTRRMQVNKPTLLRLETEALDARNRELEARQAAMAAEEQAKKAEERARAMLAAPAAEPTEQQPLSDYSP